MLERLQSIEDRYNKLNELLSDPDIINDPNKLREYSKEQADIEETVTNYREYKNTRTKIDNAKQMIEDNLDDEKLEMVKTEINELTDRNEQLKEKIKLLIIP